MKRSGSMLRFSDTLTIIRISSTCACPGKDRMRNALEQLLRGDMTVQQFAERVALDAKHHKENRERARSTGRLVEDPALFQSEHELTWKQHRGYAGILWAYGYEPGKEQTSPMQLAFHCDGCKGWIKGEPRSEDYNEISFLSGSRGTRYFCPLDDALIGETITEMS